MNKAEKWSYLFDQSRKLTKPFSIDGLVSPAEIVDLERAVIRVLNRFLDEGQLNKGIKVYVNKELRNDLVGKMAEIRPNENESLEAWGRKIFGLEKFGLVFNYLEDYDNGIAEHMATIVEPLLLKAGLPLGGLSFLFFMGNYGMTPFGIHKEAKGEEGFLFHLGPSEKDFFAWDNEELNSIEHNTKVFHEEIEEMLPSSKKYVLKAGSVMFIPHQVYHIANTAAFSLSIVMDYVNPSRDHLEKELAKEISKQEDTSGIREAYLAPVPFSDSGQNLEGILDANFLLKRYSKFLERRILLLRSNGGILRPSISNNKATIPNGEFSLRKKKGFPICHLQDSDQTIFLFARGHEILKKSNSNLKDLVNGLNSGHVFEFEALKNQLMPEWDLVDVYGFVSELLIAEAIEIAPFQ